MQNILSFTLVLLLANLLVGCNRYEKEIKLTTIQIDEALKNCDLNKAVEQLKILIVYDPNNKTAAKQLNSLENLISEISKQDYQEAVKAIQSFEKNDGEYLKLEELEDCIVQIHSTIVGLKEYWDEHKNDEVFKVLNDGDISCAMLMHQAGEKQFYNLELRYNRIYEITKTESPQLNPDKLNVAFLIATHQLWNNGVRYIQIAGGDRGKRFRDMGIIEGSVPDLHWETFRSYNIGKEKLTRAQNEPFEGLTQGYVAGQALVRFLSNIK